MVFSYEDIVFIKSILKTLLREQISKLQTAMNYRAQLCKGVSRIAKIKFNLHGVIKQKTYFLKERTATFLNLSLEKYLAVRIQSFLKALATQ